jgi:hypothetical protein
MEQIKLTAELLAEGWGFHELHRMARAGELQRIRRGAYECAPREITRAARATSSSDCSNSPSDVSRRSRQPHVSRCAASAPHLEQPARTSSHHPRWVGGRKGTQLRPSSCGPTTSDRGMRDRGSASYHAGAHRTRPAANADDGAVRAHRRCSAQTGPDAGGSGRTRGPMHRLARHAPSAASHELPGSTKREPRRVVQPCRVASHRRTGSHAAVRGMGTGGSGWSGGFLLGGVSNRGEFDGSEKYGQPLKPGKTAADAVFEEKRREDALRDLGWQIVRWIWQDLYHPEDLRRRLERAFERGLRAA